MVLANLDMFPAFGDVEGLHPTLLKNLRAMEFTHMTEIQAKTWEAASSGQDVLGRARTGTGKTVSFLLPALQQLLNRPNLSKNIIHMLVLSPTRELAQQIDDEAQKLTRGSGRSIGHQVVFGGSSRPKDVAQLERRVPTILVATPGRLQDHLENTSIRGQPFSKLLGTTSILVLDETDRLLDMGFSKQVLQIIDFLPPKEERQTLLFSATVPDQVKAVMAATMRQNFVTADCIHDTDPATHTNQQVQQRHVILPYSSRLVTGTVQLIWELIQSAKAQNETLKMVVFFNTANIVAYYAALFEEALGISVLELHSRKSQSHRTKTADRFRAADEAILFTSDVSARGVDYPNVTNVVQVGIADSRESYIHRLGRTGRAGKVGEGLLILYNVEQKFLEKLDGIHVPRHEELQQVVDQKPKPALMKKLQPVLDDMKAGTNERLVASLESAYRSMLGFYNGKLSKQLGVKDPAVLIDFVNEFATQGGCAEIPGIEKKTIGKMGLRYTTGLNITANRSKQNSGGNQRGGGGKPLPKRQNSNTGTPEAKKSKTANKGGSKKPNNEQQQGGNGGNQREGGTNKNGSRSTDKKPLPKRQNSSAGTPEAKKPKTNSKGGSKGSNKQQRGDEDGRNQRDEGNSNSSLPRRQNSNTGTLDAEKSKSAGSNGNNKNSNNRRRRRGGGKGNSKTSTTN